MGATRPQPDRSIRTPVNWLVCLAIALCAIPLVGCGGKDHFVNPTARPSPYEVPLDPTAVLRNLAKAYSSRDSSGYKSLFDVNYQGTSIDQQDPSPQLLNFTKADEAQHIAGLAKSTTVTNVSLELTPVMTRTADAGDPVGWAMIQNPIFRLSIVDGTNESVLTGADEEMEFHFIPTLDSSSPTDTTWKIVKWVEVRR